MDPVSRVIIEPGDGGKDGNLYLKENSIGQVLRQGYSTVDIKAAYNGTKASVGIPRDDMSIWNAEASVMRNDGVKEDPYNGG